MMEEKYILIMVTNRFALVLPPEIHDTFDEAYASLTAHANALADLDKHEYDLRRFNYAMYRVDGDLNIQRVKVPYVDLKVR